MSGIFFHLPDRTEQDRAVAARAIEFIAGYRGGG